MLERELATIQIISKLEAIPEKDRIVLASFRGVGYKVIVKKGDFNLGDFAIYFEDDSLLPINPAYEFLRKSSFNEKLNGFRIKCMKMGGVYSEGLSLPLGSVHKKIENPQEGMNVTEPLEIRKYDPEIIEENEEAKSSQKNHGPIINFFLKFKFIRNYFYPLKKRGFPSYLPKTDETRGSALTHAIEDNQGKLCYISEKMDGQNLNFIQNGKEFFLCSRNNRVTVQKGSKYEKVIERYDIKNKMKSLKKELKHNFALQGELCGPGIQGNKYGFSDYMYFIYNFFDIDKKEYLRFKYILFILDYMNLKTVPILNNNFVLNHTQDELLELSKGKSIFADIPREGIVIRSLDCEKGSNKMGPIWGFKEINPDFKLKYEGR